MFVVKNNPYIRLMRVKHYLKNVLIFLPLVFSGRLLESDNFINALVAFIIFSLAASCVYIINDLRDRHLDALHPKKKLRPLASGEIKPLAAMIVVGILLATSFTIHQLAGFSTSSLGLLLGYIAINVLYSAGLKNIPVLDVTILSLGFVLRVYYGGLALGISVSKWLYLAILAFSFYMSLGKRRNEMRTVGKHTRKVNRFYTQDFLDKNMYAFFGLTIVYYSMWVVDPAQTHKRLIWTVPLVIIIAMTYSLAVESSDSDGDPVSVLLSNKPLLIVTTLTCLLTFGLVYA